jgi:hypothetical protein
MVLVACLVAGAALAPAAVTAQAAVSGVDQYTEPGPSAGGKGNTPAAPVAHPENLSPQARQALAGQPDAANLTKIATSPELGAPDPASGKVPAAAVSNQDPSAPKAASDALGLGGWAAVAAAIALAGGVAVVARNRRRGRST